MQQAQIGHHSKDRRFLEAVVEYVVSHGPDSAGSRNRTERKGGGIHSRGGRLSYKGQQRRGRGHLVGICRPYAAQWSFHQPPQF